MLHSEFLSNLRFPWKNRVTLKFFTVLNILFTFRSFEALVLKNRVALEFFIILNMYFLSLRIFEQLELALKNRVVQKFFAVFKILVTFRFLNNLRLPRKTEVALNSLYWMYIFYYSRILSNLRLPWKQSCPDIFQARPSLRPRLVRLCF